MSKKTDKFEADLANAFKINTHLPNTLPDWMLNEGIVPGAKIINAVSIGNKDKNNKTDVLVSLENSNPLKISVKLANADYFGNWYSHDRIIREFGTDVFNKLTKEITDWANEIWKNNDGASLFVGVSVSFGKRTGNTLIDFEKVFQPKDVLPIVKGFDDNTESQANALYIDDKIQKNLKDIIENLRPITLDSIKEATEQFRIICRPVNPMTSYSDRGKNVYTQFVPFEVQPTEINITTQDELLKLGTYKVVSPTSLNHNHILNTLQEDYNIVIPKKPKEKKS